MKTLYLLLIPIISTYCGSEPAAKRASERYSAEASPADQGASPVGEDAEASSDLPKGATSERGEAANDSEPQDTEEASDSAADDEEVADEEEASEEDPVAEVDPFKVQFVIPAGYDGTGPINTPETALKLKVYPSDQKQELVITNMSDQVFRLHTGGSPCGHAPRAGEIQAGESYTCVITRTITSDQGESAVYDHNAGTQTSIYLVAEDAPDPQ